MFGGKKILIDGYNLSLETGTGVATYARNLSYMTHALGYATHILYGTRATSSSNRLLREIAFFDPIVKQPSKLQPVRHMWQLPASMLGARAVEVPLTGKVVTTAYRSRLPFFDQLWNVPDLFGRSNRYFHAFRRSFRVRIPGDISVAHWTYPLPIRVVGAKNIYTMHDLVPLRLPYTTLDNKNRYFALMRMLVRQADHIVTVSETSRKDIINLLGVSPSKVTNTYQTVEIPDKYKNKPEVIVKKEVEGTFNLIYKDYFLFFGAIEPKKNIGRLIEGYLGSNVSTPLVVLGKLAWKSKQELGLLNDYLEYIDNTTLTRRRIVRINYAPYPLLISIIRGAKAVLFPSLYEGFGLPVLEAMKLGTPVLTSTEGSTPEVAGNAALLVDPYDTRAIAEGITALDGNAELRGDLSRRGILQADLFSTERYQKSIDELYKRLI